MKRQMMKLRKVDVLVGKKGGGSVGVDVEAKLNTVNMRAWVHKECDTIEEETLDKLRAAWDCSEQKDECIVCLNDLERASGWALKSANWEAMDFKE